MSSPQSETVTSFQIKQIAYDLGADLCGIAPVERFRNAPEGFMPRDIYNQAKCVVVYAKRLPQEVLFAQSCIPYTQANSMICTEVDRISLKLSFKLESLGVGSVMIPSDDPYEYWDDHNQYGRGIMSLRHAAELAGLGRLGKNSLLINRELGNMVQIGALLVNRELVSDDLVDYEVCPEGCRLCLDSCPRNALDGITVNQQECRPLSNFRNGKGYILKKCCECRKVCPSALGVRSWDEESIVKAG